MPEKKARGGARVYLSNLSAFFLQFLSLLPLSTRCRGAQTVFFFLCVIKLTVCTALFFFPSVVSEWREGWREAEVQIRIGSASGSRRRVGGWGGSCGLE